MQECDAQIAYQIYFLEYKMSKKPIKAFLAPMAGYTDHAFRQTCRLLGADAVYSEMISAKAIHYKDKKTTAIAEIFAEESPIGIQIFGKEPEIMAEAAVLLASGSYSGCKSHVKPDSIDINMGCPAPKVVNNGEGSALMKDPKLASRIIETCKNELASARIKIPLTVKMRIGWDEKSINGVEFAKMVAASGADELTVHGRTREGRFSAPINFEEISQIKVAVDIPVIANGEIFSADDAFRLIDRTGCDGVMIGRGALGNPWIFSEIRAKCGERKYLPPSETEKVATALAELKVRISEKGERAAVIESRKQLALYFKGLRGAAEARGLLNSVESFDDVYKICNKIIADCNDLNKLLDKMVEDRSHLEENE